MTEQPNFKEQGNELFKAGQYKAAIDCYELALGEKDTPKETKAILYGNKAACFLKLEKYKETVKEASKSLEFNPVYVKSLFRRCQASEQLLDFHSAFSDAQTIVKISPHNKAAQEIFNRTQSQLKKLQSDNTNSK